MAKKTLLLVFIHGFKGTAHTFENFPKDLRALLQHSLPGIDVLSIVYPPYETRGDLHECVAKFTDWLQNKVIDLEAENHTPAPTINPSVHVVLCGHSMGGILAAETLLRVANGEAILPNGAESNNTANATASTQDSNSMPVRTYFFPHIQAVVAFDTPYLGISPGVLAHGAEEQINTASNAYKAFNTASSIFGWGSSKSSTAASVSSAAALDSSTRGLPAAESIASPGTNGWGKWGKIAAVGGAAAAIAGATGAAYLSRNQISQGIAWAGSHLEFVGCLARGAELQRRVERVVELTRSHGIGFADYYTSLDVKVSSRTKYAGAMLGEDRTFCVVPKQARSVSSGSPTGTKRSAPIEVSSEEHTPPKKKPDRSGDESATAEQEGEQVRNYAADPSRSKGLWVKCVNPSASDEVRAHTSMFTPQLNPGYHSMLPMTRDQIVEWIDKRWSTDRGAENHNDDENEGGNYAAAEAFEASGDDTNDDK